MSTKRTLQLAKAFIESQGGVVSTETNLAKIEQSLQPTTEWIVWRVVTDGHDAYQSNVMGIGFRFNDKREAERIARDISALESEYAQRATDGNWTVSIYLVPCPGGEMVRDESLWELVAA